MRADELIHEIPKGLLGWYDFQPGKTALYTGQSSDGLAEMLAERGLQVACCPIGELDGLERFDYIVSVADLETLADPEPVLARWRELLKPDGRLLLGMNNRLGTRYFCGDRDPYTGRNFDGVENYRRAYVRREDSFRGRCWSRAELGDMLDRAGWRSYRFYSVLSSLEHPSHIFAEDYLPREDLACRVVELDYHSPGTIFLEEEGLYASLLENGMFHQMANAFLIECSLNGGFADVNQVTCSLDRSREDAQYTVLRRSGTVEKRAAYPQGLAGLERQRGNEAELAARGISVVPGRLEGGAYITPYVDGQVGQAYLRQLLLTDKEKFLREMDRFMELILRSSGHLQEDAGDGEGVTLERAYLDMVPLNSFYVDGEFVFFDQEFSRENCPANLVMTRAVGAFYTGNMELEKFMPMEGLLRRYGLLERASRWNQMQWEFSDRLLNKSELWRHYASRRRDPAALHSNRQRMNYSVKEYDRLFVDIFRNTGRKLILFGSGKFAKEFMALYGGDYPPAAIVDNSRDSWGRELNGVAVQSPELLRQLQPGTFKVLICIKNYLSVMEQLDGMGITEYSVFDPHMDYPRKWKPAVQEPQAGTEAKPFRVGYVAGVFDLFHIGHLNLLRRAKEQCGYLVVGVVTDRGVRENKRVEPVIPFEERLELVRACRYVDEAVEIPFGYAGTREAYKLYRFDCQFSGSDYADDPSWLEGRDFLRANGAEMIFFPYTESTSSSKLKELIRRKLV